MNATVTTRAALAPPKLGEHDLHTPGIPSRVDLLGRLESICAERGLGSLADRLAELMSFVGADLASFEEELSQLPRREDLLIGRSATHLLEVGGKRLRPLCVALAARLGNGFDAKVLDLAVAVELVHSATLLHDDVVDHSDTRRGRATARSIYTNAASIFGGDWLLIEALRRVERCALPGLLPKLFSTIEEMIFAESVQLQNRGKIRTDRADYFRVVEGKTAALFRWGMWAGGFAGGLGEAERQALADYGDHLGVAFQAIDDLLDLTGDATKTGKALFIDLREGKMTFPLIVALEREPELEPILAGILRAPAEEPVPDADAVRIVEILRTTRAVEDCLTLAREHSAKAVACLEILPPSRAVLALVTVAQAIVDRDL